MNSLHIKSWREYFVAATVAFTFQLTFVQSPAEAAAGTAKIIPPTAGINNAIAVSLGTAATSNACVECTSMPAAIRDRVAGLVVTTTLSDGSYVAVWQNKYDNLVYGQCYSREDQPSCAVFRIEAEVEDGILPLILSRKDGGFIAKWQQDGKRFEQHFNPLGVALGDGTKLE